MLCNRRNASGQMSFICISAHRQLASFETARSSMITFLPWMEHCHWEESKVHCDNNATGSNQYGSPFHHYSTPSTLQNVDSYGSQNYTLHDCMLKNGHLRLYRSCYRLEIGSWKLSILNAISQFVGLAV